MDKKNIEAIYLLTPMQQALLFHSVRMGKHDPGLLQLRCTLHGQLDIAAFEHAWENTLTRHPALRTSLHWKELDRPLQAVLRRVRLPWTHQDWTDASPVEQQERLDAFFHTDRARALDLSQAPVMRLALFQVTDDQWHLVWTCHHALLDGWSGALVLKDVSTLYEAYCRNEDVHLPTLRSYRDYVAWRHQHNVDGAEAFWRQTLSGITVPTPLPFERAPENGTVQNEKYRNQEIELTAAATAALQSVARQHRLTLNTLLQGTWAMILSHHSGREEVVFGATVSGRSANLPGIESMVGLFINTLPVRVRVARDASILSVLKQLLDTQTALRNYEHISLEKIHTWSDMPNQQRLFESLLVFENYPLEASTTAPDQHLAIRDLQGGITTNYPLTIVAAPGEALSLQIIYDRRRFEPDHITRLLLQLQTVLHSLAADPNRPVLDVLPAENTKKELSARTDAEGTRGNGRAAAFRSTSRASFVAPRNALERQLTGIWEDEMHVRPISVHDDFFDLGGHSLLAVRLLDQIQAAFAVDLPLRVLFEAPTIAEMAAQLAQLSPSRKAQPPLSGARPIPTLAQAFADEQSPDRSRQDPLAASSSPLVAIRAAGTRPPLYCVHGIGTGILVGFASLARLIDPDQPVYGIQGAGRDGTPIPHTTTEQMAAYYAEEICRFQPEGPLMLTGFCYGSLVALAMAHELRRRGREIPLLIMIDAENPLRYPQMRGGASKRGVRSVPEWQEHLQNVRKEGLPYLVRKARASIPQRLIWVRHRLSYLVCRLYHGLGRPVPHRLRSVYVHTTYRRIIGTYRPEPYDGPVVVFRSGANQHPDPAMGWETLMEDLKTIQIEGGHYMLRDSLDVLAPQLDRVIAEAATTAHVPR